jgi:hypothetical protein
MTHEIHNEIFEDDEEYQERREQPGNMADDVAMLKNGVGKLLVMTHEIHTRIFNEEEEGGGRRKRKSSKRKSSRRKNAKKSRSTRRRL